MIILLAPLLVVICVIFSVRAGNLPGPRGVAGWIAASCALVGALGWPLAIGVWPPDVLSGRTFVLASAASQTGDRFQVVHYWNYSDFYTTELEHLSADGTLKVTQIDWDDTKQWSCEVRVIDEEKKVLITFPSEPEVWEYRWDLGYIVAPYNRKDIPFMLNPRRRTTLTTPSKA